MGYFLLKIEYSSYMKSQFWNKKYQNIKYYIEKK